MDLNLYIMKNFLPFPIRFCVKNAGPLSSSLIMSMKISIGTARMTNADSDKMTSRIRLMNDLYMKEIISQVDKKVFADKISQVLRD